MRAALYARVSTKDKDQDPETQLMRLRDYCHTHSIDCGDEAFVDYASGKDLSRPALDRLMDAARSRSFDAVIVQRVDRFARSLTNLIHLLEELDSLGVGFICTDQPIDLKSPLGRFTLAILGAAAQLERELTVERVMDGLERARRQGKALGRPPRRYTEAQEAVLRQCAAGEVSVQEMMQSLRISKSTAYRLLSDHNGGEEA